MDNWIKTLGRFCELHNSDSEESYDQFVEEFGEDTDFDSLVADMQKEYPDTQVAYAGEFDSPGYDMKSYAVAWLKKGKVQLETFVVEWY